MSDFYCPCINFNYRIAGSQLTGTQISPCCVYRPQQVYRTIDQYNNSNEIKELRQMQSWPLGCQVCQQQEKNGQKSYRTMAIDTWQGDSNKKMRYEILPSNVCNLKCIMCGPDASSALAQENYELGLVDKIWTQEYEETEKIVEWLQNENNFHSISLIGGEFFLAKHADKFLDFVINKQIPLRISTNATVITERHLKKLKLIQNLTVQISVDGYQDSYEFMRYPAKWTDFAKNVNVLTDQLANADFNFNFTFQPLNAQYLVPLLIYTNSLKIPTRVSNLTYPFWLNWQILNNEEKGILVEHLHQQSKSALIATNQKQMLASLCQTIASNVYHQPSRNFFFKRFCAIMAHRSIDLARQKQHLGLLSSLLDANFVGASKLELGFAV